MLNIRQINMLKRIARAGGCFTVLHSFGIASAVYGDDYDDESQAMSSRTYQFIRRMLFTYKQMWTVFEKSPPRATKTYQQQMGDYLLTTEVQEIKGKEYELSRRYEPLFTDTPQTTERQLVSVDTEYDNDMYEWTRVESEWFTMEHVNMGDEFEEFVGIVKRYWLTDKAKEMIVNNS